MKCTYQNHNLLEQYFHQQYHSSGCPIKRQIDFIYIRVNIPLFYKILLYAKEKCLKAIKKIIQT